MNNSPDRKPSQI